MTRTNVTQIAHYMNYPVCGFCTTAWDIVYMRNRSRTSPGRWVEYCKVGGCDPDIWDFLDEDTGWPADWPLIKDGAVLQPDWAEVMFLDPPKYEDRCYHRRKTARSEDDMAAPWRKIGRKLMADNTLRRKRLAGQRVSAEEEAAIQAEAEMWDEPAPRVRETVPPSPAVDLDDPDLW